MIDVIKM